MVCSCAIAFCMMFPRLSKRGPFSGVFKFWEHPEIARRHARRVGEPSEPPECRVWPGNHGSSVINELRRCHDAAASCLHRLFHYHRLVYYYCYYEKLFDTLKAKVSPEICLCKTAGCVNAENIARTCHNILLWHNLLLKITIFPYTSLPGQ
jgi:hypothetical protein